MNLDGKVAIVTGSTSGIGQAIASVMAAQGASVVVCGRRIEKGQAIADEINRSGGEAMALKLDISRPDEIDALAKKTLDMWGHIDVIVNNATYLPGTSPAQLHEEDPAEWDNHINTTLKGTLHCCRAVIPHMIERRFGRIINISTVAAKVGVSGGPYLYPGCKAAIVAISRCLALDLGRHGITVNCVAPGPTKTDTLMEQPQEFLDKMARAVPIKRMGEPEDIAHMVAFLASDEAGFITGQHYSVDGGTTMS